MRMWFGSRILEYNAGKVAIVGINRIGSRASICLE